MSWELQLQQLPAPHEDNSLNQLKVGNMICLGPAGNCGTVMAPAMQRKETL